MILSVSAKSLLPATNETHFNIDIRVGYYNFGQ